jgi:hypothetical protein
LSPSVPASGESLTRKDMVTVGGSIGCAVIASVTDGSQKVSATVPLERPAMATMSPACARRSAGAQAAEGENLRDAAVFQQRAVVMQHFRLVRLQRAGGDAAGDDAAEERIGFQDRADHAEGPGSTVGSGTCFSTRSNSGARP